MTDTDDPPTTGMESSTGDEPPPPGQPAEPDFFLGLDYGPGNEPCHDGNEGERIDTSDDWMSDLDDASDGDVLLFEEGEYATDQEIVVRDGVTLFAYECDEVRFVVTRAGESGGTGSAIRVGDDSVVAGVTIEGTNTESIIRFEAQQDSVTIRNNNLYGGQNDAIAFTGTGVSDVNFDGNYINSGPAASGGGHLVFFSATSMPETVSFVHNKIEGSYYGDVGQGDQAVGIDSGRDITFEENWFNDLYNTDRFWDVRTHTTASEGGATVARRNWFANGCLGTFGGASQLGPGGGEALHYGDHPAPEELPIHVFEANRVEIATGRCTTFFRLAQNLEVKLRMEGNVFISDNEAAPEGGQSRNLRDVVIAHNTFFRGSVFKLSDDTGFLVDNGSGLVITENIFYRSNVLDRSDNARNVHVVSNNIVYDMADALEGGMLENNLDEDPLFTSVVPDSLDLRLKPASPAVGAAADGRNLGAY